MMVYCGVFLAAYYLVCIFRQAEVLIYMKLFLKDYKTILLILIVSVIWMKFVY